MSRGSTIKQRRKVGAFEHKKSGEVVAIYLEDSGEFSATTQSTQFKAATVKDMENKICAFLDHKVEYTWTPFIFVATAERQMTFGHAIGKNDDCWVQLWIMRLHFSKGREGSLAYVGWDVPVEHRHLEARWHHGYGSSDGGAMAKVDWPLTLPLRSSWSDKQGFFLNYSDEAWSKLTLLREQLGRIRHALAELVGSREGMERLALPGDKVLQLLEANHVE